MSDVGNSLESISPSLDVINSDALAPYVLLAWGSNPDLRSIMCHGSSTMSIAVLRHIRLLAQTSIYSSFSEKIEFSYLLPLARRRVAFDEHAENPLVRYLSRRRSEITEILRQGADDSEYRGQKTWAEIRRDRDLSLAFDEHMVRRATCELNFEVEPSAKHLLVDIGGGPGQYAALALRKLPNDWKAVIVDTYPQAGWFADREAPDLNKRISVAISSGSLSLPHAGLYLIANVLHNLTDSQALELLHMCAELSSPTSRVLLVERGWNPRNLRDSSRDLDMRILFGGRERTNAEIRRLLKKAGFAFSSSAITVDGYRLLVARTKEN